MNAAIMKTIPTSTLFDTDAQRWEAVTHRDARADDAFFYSVRTTGVYCRPSCASRLARRENVAFHATRADAERAGFRPCKRCRPNEAPLAERQAEAVAESVPPDRGGRRAAVARRTRRRGRHEPLPFSSRLQSSHRRNAEGVRGCAPRRARAQRIAEAGNGDRCDLRSGLQFQRSLLCANVEDARHEAERLSRRRQR